MQFVSRKENAEYWALVIRHSSSIDVSVSASHLEGIAFPLFDVLDGKDVVVAVDENGWFVHIPSKTCKHEGILALGPFDQIDFEASPLYSAKKEVSEVSFFLSFFFLCFGS